MIETGDIADRLGVAYSTIRSWIQKGFLVDKDTAQGRSDEFSIDEVVALRLAKCVLDSGQGPEIAGRVSRNYLVNMRLGKHNIRNSYLQLSQNKLIWISDMPERNGFKEGLGEMMRMAVEKAAPEPVVFIKINPLIEEIERTFSQEE